MQVFTSILVLGIVFTVFIFSDIHYYKERKVKSLTSLTQVIASNTVSTLQFQDNEAAANILSELHDVTPDLSNVWIIDSTGALFASFTAPGATTFHPVSYKKDTVYFTTNHLLVSSPILSGNDLLGHVYLQAELKELSQIKATYFKTGSILFIVALVVSFLIAITVQPYISKRLLKLVKAIKKVSKEGDYSQPISDDGHDEISVLIQAYNQLMQQVKENLDRKDEFIGIASHELKTPLTSIKGYVELLDTMEDSQPKKQFVEKTLSNVNKLEVLIKDLLDVSKIQSGQLELNKQNFCIDDLLNDAIISIQQLSTTHKIIQKDMPGNQMVYGDRQRIEQVVINLLSNAIKYSPGAKEIVVSTEVSAHKLTIKVRDFGLGIHPDEAGNIFERFYRTRDNSVNISGFGLGLYICRDIVQRHQGEIGLVSEVKGSTFYFVLPLNENREAVA